MERIALSTAIITLNEEERLPGCLNSLAGVDDIVVVDSGSSDGTVAIAEQFGARVFQEPWRGFGPQKQFAVDQCRNDWVLILDADERIPPETMVEIAAILRNPAYDAYRIPRKNYFSGKWIRGMGWWPDRVVRLFRKQTGRMSDRQVHESVVVEGEAGSLANPLIHLTNRNLRQTLDKLNRYSTIGAEELYQRGVRSSILKAVLRGGWAIFYNYFFRLGFLDGPQGIVVAVSDGVNIFYKYAKLHEMWSKTAETEGPPQATKPK